MAFSLQRSGTKYRYLIWAKRSTAWRAVMIHSSFIWCRATQLKRETKLNRLNNRDFPLHAFNFAQSVPRAHVALSSEPWHNLLCATILDIISTCCAYVLSLLRNHSPPPHAARDPARAAAGPSKFWLRAIQWVSLRAASWYFWLHIVWCWLVNARIWVFLIFCLVGPHVCWSWWSINIYKPFGRSKIAVFLWNLVSAPCSETGPNSRASLFVEGWL